MYTVPCDCQGVVCPVQIPAGPLVVIGSRWCKGRPLVSQTCTKNEMLIWHRTKSLVSSHQMQTWINIYPKSLEFMILRKLTVDIEENEDRRDN